MCSDRFHKDEVTSLGTSRKRAVIARLLCSALALRRGTSHVSVGSFSPFCAVCRLHTVAYRQVSGVPHGAKSSKIARPILRGTVYLIGSFWYRLFIFLIIMPQPSPKIDRASGARASRQKNDSIFLLSFVCQCVAVLSTLFRDEFARRACSVNLSPLPLIEPSQKNDRASGARASRQKTTAFFAVVCLSVRSSFEHAISG